MAQAIHCDSCEKEQAVLLVTNLATGDVLGLGPNCIPAWGKAMGEAVEAELDHQDGDPDTDPGGQAPDGVTDGISPNNPATYPPAHETPDVDPHGPAETGPSSPQDVPVENDPGLDPEHPHTPAESGPGTYEEEGGAAAPPKPADPAGPPAPAADPDPADAQPVEQVTPSPAFV